MPTPPKPQALKRLAGNPGHRPIASEATPAALASLPPVPAWLPALGRKCWRELGPVLMAAGLLTAADLPAFASLCGAYGRFVEAEKQVKLRGPVIRTPAGLEQRNPWLLGFGQGTRSARRTSARFRRHAGLALESGGGSVR